MEVNGKQRWEVRECAEGRGATGNTGKKRQKTLKRNFNQQMLGLGTENIYTLEQIEGTVLY